MLKKIQSSLLVFEKLIIEKDPIRVLSFGYVSYMLFGFLLLLLPFSQTVSVGILDNLFTAASAVSTTGLVTIDPGGSYSFFGELVILLLIQLGGIGYMTFGSFIILQTGHRFSSTRENMTRTAFPLPESVDVHSFLKGVIVFTFVVELLGALVLALLFWLEGVKDFLWHGFFHSISAFCTAGFSLNSNSFESYVNHNAINMVLSVLSILGAVGFIVAIDVWSKIRGKKDSLFYTSKIILLITTLFLFFGTTLIFLLEPLLRNMPVGERLLAAFFQTMTSTSTVGFNTVPVGELSSGAILILYFLMIFGASPSGTGGGLKSTTFSALVGLVRSTLKRRPYISFLNRKIPPKRLQYAASSFVFFTFVLGLSVFGLNYTESSQFEIILFEAISALGTVGLSMGLTSDLSSFGKLIIIALMVMGRVGVLSFGLSVSATDHGDYLDGDNDLIL